MKKVLFEKTYHGFEDFSDYFRDVHEAVDSDFNPLMKEIPGEFQGRVKVVVTYEDDSSSDDIAFLQAELGTLNQLISESPEGDILGRTSLEARREAVKTELKELEGKK